MREERVLVRLGQVRVGERPKLEDFWGGGG